MLSFCHVVTFQEQWYICSSGCIQITDIHRVLDKTLQMRHHEDDGPFLHPVEKKQRKTNKSSILNKEYGLEN